MEEEWRQVPFALAYQASSLGRLIGVRGRIMRPTETDRGYFVCDLHKIQYRVNRIICTTFHGNPPSDAHQAAHKDNIRQNNEASNLYWATPLQNGDDLRKTDNMKGEMCAVSALTDADVRYLRAEHAKGIRIAELAREYPHLAASTISHATLGRTWTHVK